MATIENLYKDHKLILGLANDLSAHLNKEDVVNKSADILGLLNKLSGKIKMHLSMEDKYVYPELLKSEKDNVRDTAKRFMNEMGAIGEAYNNYVSKWSSPSKIRENPDGFIKETNEIFAALQKRILSEEKDLYPHAA